MIRAVAIYNLGASPADPPMGWVSLKHAIRMLHRKVARVHTAVPGETLGPYEKPAAVELLTYVYAKWVYAHTGKVPYSKAGLLRRDKHRCAYCSGVATTMDHVVPRCQGGSATWMNAVAACVSCNGRKGGRTPAQAGMRLLHPPFEPRLKDVYPR